MCTPVTGHPASLDVRISVFVGHRYVAVLHMLLWGSDPDTPVPPIAVENQSYGAGGRATRQHSLVESGKLQSTPQGPKCRNPSPTHHPTLWLTP